MRKAILRLLKPESLHPPDLKIWDSLSEVITDALKEIQAQQKKLNALQDSGYDLELAQQQLGRLSGFHTKIQTLLDASDYPHSSAIADVIAASRQALGQLKVLSTDHLTTEPIIADKKIFRKKLYERIMQLDVILGTLVIELAPSQTLGEPDAAKPAPPKAILEAVKVFKNDLEQEKALIVRGDMGESPKSALLKKLNLLTLQLYRLRRLSGEPHLQDKGRHLTTLALQVKDTVQSVNGETINAPELLADSICLIDRQLCRLEFNRKVLFIPLPFSWLVNRYRDITDLKSVPTRVLAGLGFSFTVSGFMMLSVTIPLTLVSAYASTTEENIRQNLEVEYSNLFTEVNQYLEIEQQREVNQDQLARNNERISEIQSQIKANKVLIADETQKLEAETAKVAAQTNTSNEDNLNAVQADDVSKISSVSDSTLASREKTKTELEKKNQTLAKALDNLEAKVQETSDQTRQDLIIAKEAIQNRLASISLLKEQLNSALENSSQVQSQLPNASLQETNSDVVASDPAASDSTVSSSNSSAQPGITKNDPPNPSSTSDKSSDNPSATPRSQEKSLQSWILSIINNEALLNHTKRIILAAFAGAIGSMMSILIRLDQMDQENIKHPFLLGALKPLIGAVFGIAVFAILSTRVIDILPSNFYLHQVSNETLSKVGGSGVQDPLGDLDSQELYKIFLIAFIAGFSERLANDTLKSVSSNKTF